LLGDIPTAQDGDVITADFHNSLRSAIVAMAGYLGDTAINHQVVLTLAPSLLGSGAGAWTLAPDSAEATSGPANGWLPVDLPDGARIQGMSVIHARTDKLDTLTVDLRRLSISSPTDPAVPLATYSGRAGDGSVQTESVQVSVAGITEPSALDELRRVVNGQYRYYISVQATGAEGQALATIYALELIYTRW
jgi:hypothetical protein